MVYQFKMRKDGKEIGMVQKGVAVTVAGNGLKPEEFWFCH
jgi:hypothetical protein